MSKESGTLDRAHLEMWRLRKKKDLSAPVSGKVRPTNNHSSAGLLLIHFLQAIRQKQPNIYGL